MTTEAPEIDPLEAFEKRPSLSFDVTKGGYAKGEKAHLIVKSYGELIVDRDPDTKEIEYWPLKPGQTTADPKKKYVLNVLDVTDPNNPVEKTLWAKPVRKGAALFASLIAAQAKVRQEIDPRYRMSPGDELFVVYTGDDTSVPAKKGNHPKMFAAKLVPGKAEPPTEDPFADAASPSSNPERPSAHDSDPFGGVPTDDEPPF